MLICRAHKIYSIHRWILLSDDARIVNDRNTLSIACYYFTCVTLEETSGLLAANCMNGDSKLCSPHSAIFKDLKEKLRGEKGPPNK
jgi:hypothetical protein